MSLSKQVAGAASPDLRGTGSGKAEMCEWTGVSLTAAPAKKKLSVLIVDDDSTIRTIHTILVNRVGVEVESKLAENGKVAVDLFRAGESFDLVLMDWEMPVMNGIEATKELRNMGVSSMIVGVTSHSMDTEKGTFMAAGLDDCYGKPLSIKILKNILQKMKIDD
ncbi:two-component response regulator 24-like [Syzygium oleosum]|uniref:two-component response regulator 24-like n=1 Tax=Syzygium oleosum TaxID=219896 RepID=UPI0024BB4369|nr:two-component response regulator 24-like [Syzygium oleosum]